jgi:hypothetical protein
MANFVTNKCKYEVFTGDANLDAATIKMLLLKSSTPDQDKNFVTDLTPGTNELTVGGYSRQTLGGVTITEDDANDVAYMDATDPAFTSLVTGETATWAVTFRFVTNDTDSPVYAGYDITDTPTNGGTLNMIFSAPPNGVLKAA